MHELSQLHVRAKTHLDYKENSRVKQRISSFQTPEIRRWPGRIYRIQKRAGFGLGTNPPFCGQVGPRKWAFQTSFIENHQEIRHQQLHPN